MAKALAYYDCATQDLEPYSIYKIGQYLEEGSHPDCKNFQPNKELALKYYREA